MLVKICGIKNKKAAKAAADAGADFIGFVFADSKRRVTPEQAAEIAEVIPPHVKKAGVFVNETREVIEETAAKAGLDIIQLHGDETADFASSLSLPVIRAFEMKKGRNLSNMADYKPAYYLLDSPTGAYRGGNGTVFDWNLADQLSISPNQIILAGGLNAENVEEAILTVKPAAVDVSSGVETNGEKDIEKIQVFIRKAKQAFQTLKESEMQ